MSHIWSYTLSPGGKWSGVIGRGKLIRFTALEAGANLSMLLYHADNLAERYNMPDTLKAQHTAHLTTGNVLMSDNGRILASIVADSLGWHDPIGGYTHRDFTNRQYGHTNYQVQRNEWLRSGQENFAKELMRNGLGLRDLVPPLNLFSKVVCDDEGNLHYDTDHCRLSATVTLRTEMKVLMALSNTPNPFDPRTVYPSVPVRMDVLPAEAVDPAADACVNLCPENQRAFENTWAYHLLADEPFDRR